MVLSPPGLLNIVGLHGLESKDLKIGKDSSFILHGSHLDHQGGHNNMITPYFMIGHFSFWLVNHCSTAHFFSSYTCRSEWGGYVGRSENWQEDNQCSSMISSESSVW